MESDNQITLHEDWTGSSLCFWQSGGVSLLAVADEAGYTSVHVTKEEWIKIREKLDEIYGTKQQR